MSATAIEFRGFPKIPRLNRAITITEKIDGTNACVIVTDAGAVYAQSRKRLITSGADNFGFAQWVQDHADQLRELGPGYHYGEWYGKGIQRGYDLDHRRFALFDVNRWGDGEERPACVGVVPVVGRWGTFSNLAIEGALRDLKWRGSRAVPGFMRPEGVVVYHHASGHLYKALLENDEQPKGLAA